MNVCTFVLISIQRIQQILHSKQQFMKMFMNSANGVASAKRKNIFNCERIQHAKNRLYFAVSITIYAQIIGFQSLEIDSEPFCFYL